MLLLSMASFAQNWAPAGDRIKSPWAEKVDPANPLPEYPRPQMVRPEWQNLNGLWDYAITPVDADYSPEGQILVPFCAESSLSGVQKTVGEKNALWYERTFTVPKKWKGKQILLHFGAVDWKSEVWVNGQKLGTHTGGYTPFSYDITSALKKSGKQTVRVKVWDATDNSYQPRGKQVCASSGIWYTPVTGIWQTVWLEPVGATSIVAYNPVFSAKENTLTVEVTSQGVVEGDVIKVALRPGKLMYSAETPANEVLKAAEVKDGKAVIPVEDAQLWSSEHPYLYGLNISISRAGKLIDSVEGYTALRTVSVVADPKIDRNMNSYKRLGVNGKRTFMYGPLDQGWWPDGLYTAPTDEALKFDIQKTKDWGWNMIRKHIKVEPARWYYWCDAMGIMVWQDMPCIGDYSSRVTEYRDPEIRENTRSVWSRDSFLGGKDAVIPEQWKANYYKEWGEIISALKPFQCIVVWVPFNESWGQFDTPEVVKFTRAQDPTRLINEASGGNFTFSGDIIDVHHYSCPAMNAFEAKMVNVLGEYGGLGYPVEGHLWQQDKNWGYGKVLESGEEVLALYDTFAQMLKTFISTGCSAAVYTQTTDVEIEVNGIMTYDRKVVKVNEKAFHDINASVVNSL